MLEQKNYNDCITCDDMSDFIFQSIVNIVYKGYISTSYLRY